MQEDVHNAINVLNEVKQIKGTKAKLKFLSSHKNDILELILMLAYNKDEYNWKYTLKQIMSQAGSQHIEIDMISVLAWMMYSLDKTTTGDNACRALNSFIQSLPEDESNVIKNIINHNLKIGLSAKSINTLLQACADI